MDPIIKRVERDLTDLQRSLSTKRCYSQHISGGMSPLDTLMAPEA